MLRIRFALLAAVFGSSLLVTGPALAQSYKLEPLAEAPPDDLAAPVKAALAETGYRVLKPDGKPLLDVWVPKNVPAKAKPAGPEAAVLFPFLREGELLGAVRYAAEGGDYRDQAIEPGVYTLRYGLQPINGDHLGVSPYRDYGLLLPAKTDAAAEPVAQKAAERQSAEVAGSNHPAILMLVQAPAGAAEAKVHEDAAKKLSGVVLPLPLKVGDAAMPFPVQLIVVGAAPL